MSHEPTLEEQAKFYDKWNESYRADEFDGIDEEIRSRAEEVLTHLDEIDTRGARILEIGCGTGWLTQQLNRFGKVTAVDLSPLAIQIARDRDDEAHYIAGDILEYQFDDATFDVVICVETLFYVEDQSRLIDLIAQWIKPNGTLALTNINKFVYDRSSDIGEPEEGQVRRWLSRRKVIALISGKFKAYRSFTVAPRGDEGILRIANSRKLNAALQLLLSPASIRRIKERAGLGGGVVIFARRRHF